MQRILEGLRVVELSRLIAAPLCGLQLQDWGAEVVKVEPPEGDYTRTLEPFFSPGDSAYHHMLNRGKRHVALDLRRDEAKDMARRLVHSADVVLDSLGEGSRYLGTDFATARADNPKLIWCAVTGTGLGDGGRAIDPTLQASMGMMALTGEPYGAPMRLPVPLVDFMTAMYATQSVLAALLHVGGGGDGALLDCALVDAAATLTSSAGVYALSGQELRRIGSQNKWYVPATNCQAADGEWVQLMAINEHHWNVLATALGHPEWIDDPRCAGNDARVANREWLHGEIAAAVATDTAEHWSTTIAAAGGFCQRIREIEEAWEDPLLDARGLRAHLDGPSRQGFPLPVASLARAGDAADFTPAPPIGGHSVELARDLGYDESTVEAMLASGALVAGS